MQALAQSFMERLPPNVFELRVPFAAVFAEGDVVSIGHILVDPKPVIVPFLSTDGAFLQDMREPRPCAP
jgi:hypothetical protein